MSKYPITKIEEPWLNETTWGEQFILRGSCKPSFFRSTRELSIYGEHGEEELLNGHFLVYLVYDGKLGDFKVIGAHSPDTKAGDVLPEYQKKLEELLQVIAES